MCIRDRHRQVSDALAHRRERELPQNADRARHHLAFAEAGKPDTQIKRVGHRNILARMGLRRRASAFESWQRKSPPKQKKLGRSTRPRAKSPAQRVSTDALTTGYLE